MRATRSGTLRPPDHKIIEHWSDADLTTFVQNLAAQPG